MSADDTSTPAPPAAVGGASREDGAGVLRLVHGDGHPRPGDATSERLAIARLIDRRIREVRHRGKPRGSVGAEIDTAVHTELAHLLAAVLAGEHWQVER